MNSQPTLLLVAHGTQSAAGVATLRQLADLVRTQRDSLPVTLCYLDVLGPTIEQALATLAGPVVLVPAILSTGYHVRSDIPGAVGARTDVAVTAHLGPDPLLSVAVADRLAVARDGRAPRPVLLVAAGSSDPAARSDLDAAAADLSRRLDVPVRAEVAGDPDLVMTDFDIATYLMAEGVFADTIAALAAAAGTAVVSAPIGAHPSVAQLILQRYDSGRDRLEGPR